MEGKTEEARSDMARLAIIRKQREEAAKKREEERLGNNSCTSANTRYNPTNLKQGVLTV